MSKNLKKASDWIQRQIDELQDERTFILNEVQQKTQEAQDIQDQIDELSELLEKIPNNGDKEHTSTVAEGK